MCGNLKTAPLALDFWGGTKPEFLIPAMKKEFSLEKFMLTTQRCLMQFLTKLLAAFWQPVLPADFLWTLVEVTTL